MDKVFNYRKVNFNKLASYGFHFENEEYCFKKDIADGELELEVVIKHDGKISYKVIDKKFQEEYVLAQIIKTRWVNMSARCEVKLTTYCKILMKNVLKMMFLKVDRLNLL